MPVMNCMPLSLKNISIAVLVCLISATGSIAQDIYSDSLLRDLRSATKEAKKAELYTALSQHSMAKDYKKALAYAQEAVFAATKDGDHALQMRANKSLASVEYYIGLFDQAIIHFDKTASEAEKAGDEIEAINNRLNISMIHIAIGEHKKSISSLEKAKPGLTEAYRKAGRAFPVAEWISLHLNLGVSYLADGQFIRANGCLDTGIALARSRPDQRLTLFKLLLTKGKVKVREDSTSEAIALMDEAEGLLASDEGQSYTILLQEARVEAYDKMGAFPDALQLAKAGLSSARTVGSLQMGRSFAEAISRIYRKTGPSDSSIRYMDMVAVYERESEAGRVKEEMMRTELQQEYLKRDLEFAARERKSRTRVFFAFMGVSLLGISSLFGIAFYRRRYWRMNLRRLQQELEARQSDLERQRLEAEMGHKDSELERIGYELKKYSLIEGLVGDLQSDPVARQQGNSTLGDPENRLSPAPTRTRAWEEFEYRFQQIYSGFYERLNQEHPDLTLNERRLCAFLKLDMTTKEISDITGQSIRAVNMARFRLRQKLNLTNTDREIFDFLSGL